jgi:hypothetical protein
MINGTVGEQWRYAVKSMSVERLGRCPVGFASLLGACGLSLGKRS